MTVRGKRCLSVLLILVPIVLSCFFFYVANWRWSELANGMSGRVQYWFLRASPMPALVFGSLTGLLIVWVLPLHRRRPIALANVLCFLLVAGFYALREFTRLFPFVKSGAVRWEEALSFLDMIAVISAAMGFLAVAVSARIANVVPEPVRRARRAVFGNAGWLTLSAAARLFPQDGEIVIDERYRVDKQLVHGLPFDPNDRSTWGHGGKAHMLLSESARFESSTASYFQNQAHNLLTGLLAHVMLSPEFSGQRNLRSLRQIVSQPEPSVLAMLREVQEHSGSAFIRETLGVFVNMTEQTFSGVYSSTASKDTQWLSLDN